MSRVIEAIVPAGTVRMITVTREAVVYALTNVEADLPAEIGRPVWAALAALGCEGGESLLEAEGVIEDALTCADAPVSVELHYFPASGAIFMLRKGAARAELVRDLWSPTFDD